MLNDGLAVAWVLACCRVLPLALMLGVLSRAALSWTTMLTCGLALAFLLALQLDGGGSGTGGSGVTRLLAPDVFWGGPAIIRAPGWAAMGHETLKGLLVALLVGTLLEAFRAAAAWALSGLGIGEADGGHHPGATLLIVAAGACFVAEDGLLVLLAALRGGWGELGTSLGDLLQPMASVRGAGGSGSLAHAPGHDPSGSGNLWHLRALVHQAINLDMLSEHRPKLGWLITMASLGVSFFVTSFSLALVIAMPVLFARVLFAAAAAWFALITNVRGQGEMLRVLTTGLGYSWFALLVWMVTHYAADWMRQAIGL